MREDLLHFAVLGALVVPAIAVGLALGWSDGAIGTIALVAIGAGLFAGDALSARFKGGRETRRLRLALARHR